MAQLTHRKVAIRLALSDAVLLAMVMAACYLLKFGLLDDSFSMKDPGLLRFAIPTVLQPVCIYLIWLLALLAYRSRDKRVLGSDNQEYKRVVMAGFVAPAFFAITSLMFKVDISRGYLLASVSFGILTLLVNRWFWRQWIIKQRARGKMLTKVALLGPKSQIEKLSRKLSSHPADGYLPALLLPDSQTVISSNQPGKFEVVPFGSDAVDRIINAGCSTAIVLGSQNVAEQQVRALAWQLEGTGIELLVAPPLEDVAISRLAVRPVAGVPVFVLEVPKFKGHRHVLKYIFDLILGTVLLALASPIILFFALLIKAEDSGPMFFKQPRVGLNGKEFNMFKLRSMRVGADLEHAQMVAAANTSPNSVLYKNPKDPRVTRVGRFIRRWSIDELPQFLNVLRGEMSLVGPRPPLPSEVAIYESHVHRRLLVKPGITGLWQVSGKNALTWEETVALDLNYVDNWSLIGDVLLLTKTAKAVFSSNN